jgi:hypothetical protein
MLRTVEAGVARILEPEDDRVGPLLDQGAQLRVVAVHDQRRVRGELAD